MKTTLRSVQAWRAISVIAVVTYHLATEARRVWNNTDATILHPLNQFGFCGVDIFFVISGFIIVYTNFNKLGEAKKLPGYLWNRITRIYPAYILISLPSFIEGMRTHQLNLKSLLGAACLIWPFPFLANPVAWSLCYEIGFYLFFSLAFLLPWRWLPLILIGWAVCIYGDTNATWFSRLPEATHLIFSVMNLPLLFGATAAYMVRRGILIFPRALMALAALIFATGCGVCLLTSHELSADPKLRCAFLAIPAFLLIFGAVGDEIKHQRVFPKPLLYTGDASYSIYLCHYQMIMLAEALILPFKTQIHPLLWQTVTGLVTMAVGLLLYRFLEKPLVGFLHKRSEELQTGRVLPDETESRRSPAIVGAGAE